MGIEIQNTRNVIGNLFVTADVFEEIIRASRHISLREAVWHEYSGTDRKHVCLLKCGVRHWVFCSVERVFRVNGLRLDKDSVIEIEAVII